MSRLTKALILGAVCGILTLITMPLNPYNFPVSLKILYAAAFGLIVYLVARYLEAKFPDKNNEKRQ